MKKLVLLLFFAVSFVITAQDSRIEISDFNFYVRGENGICETYVTLTAYFSDGSSDDFYEFIVPSYELIATEINSTGPINPTTEYTIPFFGAATASNTGLNELLPVYKFNKKIIKLKVYAYTFERRDGRGCGSGEGTRIEHERSYSLSSKNCLSGGHSVYEKNGGDFEAEHFLKLDFEISNSIDIIENSSRTELGFEDNFEVKATTGFSRLSYNWQFQVVNQQHLVNPNNWVTLPRPSDASTFTFKAKNYNVAAVGKHVAFRNKPCFGHPQGDIQVYEIINSAPHILPNPTITPVSCFGESSGTVTFEFDRKLIAGESLGFNIVDLSNRVGTNSDGKPIYFPIKPLTITSADFEGLFLTVTGLPASKAQKFRAEFVGASQLYTDDITHVSTFSIKGPSPLVFNEPTYAGVNCFGGTDGTISLQASGGTEGNYKFELTRPNGTIDPFAPFENTFTHTIRGLLPGEYSIIIKDGEDCTANVISDFDNDGNLDIGAEIIRIVNIVEPAAPLQMVIEDSKDAAAASFTNGSISVRVFGGTPNPDSSYNVIWKDENGAVLNSVDNQVIDEGYFVTLRDIGAGSYFVSVTDANYTAATQKETCEILDTEFSISEPPPLVVLVEETNPISCNSLNEFNNPFSDGELVAHAKGGVPLGIFDNSGLPYFYTWKKEDNNGVFQLLAQETDSILGNISVGRYSVNIEDANGIILGEYVNNVLANPLDVVYDLKEPDLVTITFDIGNISCDGGNEGWAEASISGGTGDYTLLWSNGERTNRIENLESGKYLLLITDEKGCEATEQVEISAPNALSVEISEQKNPTCNDGTDGIIELVVSGGVAPYSYEWNDIDGSLNEMDGSKRTNLVAGTYSITITDANMCKFTDEIVLENPPPNLIDLGGDRTLCGGQMIQLDATFSDEGTTYQWTSNTGFSSTSPIIEVGNEGTYTVAITTPLGCLGGDSVTISTIDIEIDAHFVVSTQVFLGQEISLVNISNPEGDKVEWFFPPEGEIIVENDDISILLFNTTGAYDITLRTYQGDCYLDYTKSVIVDEAEMIAAIGDADNPFIQEFGMYPNPSKGSFKVEISLAEASEISLKLFSMASQSLVNQRKESASASFDLDYGFALASGSYILLLETANGSEIRKVLIE